MAVELYAEGKATLIRSMRWQSAESADWVDVPAGTVVELTGDIRTVGGTDFCQVVIHGVAGLDCAERLARPVELEPA